jgi:L-asparaginase
VRILATGGTNAGRADTSLDAGYRPGEVGVDSLIRSVPGIGALARLEGEPIAQVGSQDVDEALWLKLAIRAQRIFDAGEADGVVVTHGTDTVEETGYFLHLVVKSSRPIVLTGAMRPATSLSPDGPLNLYNAVAVAANPDAKGRGTMVVLNDDIHSARDVTKASTTDLHAFVSPGPGLLGTASYGRIRYFRQPTKRHTLSSELTISGMGHLPRVDILYSHAGMDSDLVRASVSQGAHGIVIAGVGNGNFSAGASAALVTAARRGVIVVRSTRAISGEVSRNIEVNDDALGFVAAGQLNPQKSRVLLQLCLANGFDRKAVQEAFHLY